MAALSFIVILMPSGPRISNGVQGPGQRFAERLDLEPPIVNLKAESTCSTGAQVPLASNW